MAPPRGSCPRAVRAIPRGRFANLNSVSACARGSTGLLADAIGRVLRAHLAIENFLDAFLPDYYDLTDFRRARLTFYQKAMLFPAGQSSAPFVRPGILQLNAVRNKLGHCINHQVAHHEVGAIYDVLQVARAGVQFESPLDAIEAFAPIACAFLSLPPPHLQKLFMDAFASVKSHVPETVPDE